MLVVIITYLFYRNIYFAIPLSVIGAYFYRLNREKLLKKKEKIFLEEFKDFLIILRDNLQNGRSVESSVISSRKEMLIFHKEDSPMIREISIIISEINMNMSVSEAFIHFANRVNLSSVSYFVLLFQTSKKSGGNITDIIGSSIDQLVEKINVEREIETLIASKQFELQVMSIVPFLIIAYMKISFPGFMKVLYGNLLGVGVMTLCLVIYVAGYLIGQKIIKIDV
ncbi:MAG: type II secretion system F family protein [Lachnospiraceae bacterium]|jgi:tight adherence protein B|nr:type II secretion system F family protein [Lachnospiraceae bacterium]